MRRTLAKARSAAGGLWWAVREIFGDAAYETYLRSAARAEKTGSRASSRLSRGDFYLDSLRRRYSRINRCC